jgi:hypothetical protein
MDRFVPVRANCDSPTDARWILEVQDRRPSIRRSSASALSDAIWLVAALPPHPQQQHGWPLAPVRTVENSLSGTDLTLAAAAGDDPHACEQSLR